MTAHRSPDGDGHDRARPGRGRERRRKPQADRLVAITRATKPELFHTPDHVTYATVPLGGRSETMKIQGARFKRLLSRFFYEKEGTAPIESALKAAIQVFEGIALFDGEERPVHLRVAEHCGRLYIDLGNEAWDAVEVSSDSWTIISAPPVRFRRPEGMRALPYPEPNGDLKLLRPFLNLGDDSDWVLVQAWLVAAYRPNIPMVNLQLIGEHGSAKTDMAELLRMLVDPHTVATQASPKDMRDLAVTAENSWLLVFDNLSRVPDWLSDGMCRLSTGAGFRTRKLYTDSEEALFQAIRPVVLTGINELATRSDLLDRSITLTLPSIKPSDRKTEEQLFDEFSQVAPRILGGIMDALVLATRRMNSIDGPMPRMADFTRWTIAAEPGLDCATGDVLAAFVTNLRRGSESALEASPIVDPLHLIIEDEPFEGMAKDLLEQLNEWASEEHQNHPDWPKTARALSAMIRRITPNLREAGVLVQHLHRTGRGGRRMRIELIDSDKATNSPA